MEQIEAIGSFIKNSGLVPVEKNSNVEFCWLFIDLQNYWIKFIFFKI